MTTLSMIVPSRETPKDVADSMSVAVRGLEAGADEAIVMACRGGVAWGKNLGAKKAAGDVLIFVDNDVRLVGDLNCLRSVPSNESYWCAQKLHDAIGRFNLNTARDIVMINACHRWEFFPWTYAQFMAVRREVFWAVGGFDLTSTWEDYGWGWAAHKAGYKHGHVPIVAEVLRPTKFPLKALWPGYPSSKFQTDLPKEGTSYVLARVT